MRITEEEKNRLEKFIQRKERKKYLYETKDQREKRRYRENYEKYDRGDNCEKCDFGNIYANDPQRYVKNIKGEWEKTNNIFKTHNKHWWENHDKKHTRHTQKETCVLYENKNILILNATIEYHHAETHDIYETDKTDNYILMRLPEYKMRFEVRKMNNFDNLPDEIYFEDEPHTTEELLKAILIKGINIYEVK